MRRLNWIVGLIAAVTPALALAQTVSNPSGAAPAPTGRAGILSTSSISTNTYSNTANSYTQAQQQLAYTFRDDCADLRVTYANFQTDSYNRVVPGPSAMTLKVSGKPTTSGVGYGQTIAAAIPAVWQNGDISVTVQPGATVTGDIRGSWQSGQTIYLTQLLTWATAPATMPLWNRFIAPSLYEGNEFGTALTDRTTDANVNWAPTTQTTGGIAVVAPISITCNYRTTSARKRVTVFGDSISGQGNADYTGVVFNGRQGNGWMQRGFALANTEYLNLGQSTMALADLTYWGVNSFGRRFAAVRDFAPTNFLLATSANDIKTNRTLAQFQANVAILKTYTDSLGIPLILSTLTPLTDTSNGTTGTYSGGWDSTSPPVRAQINAWIRTKPLGQPILDYASVVEDAATQTVFRTDLYKTTGVTLVAGGSGYAVGDFVYDSVAVGPQVLRVSTIGTGGAITALAAADDIGVYSGSPTGTRTLADMTGSGSGATVTLTGVAAAGTPSADGVHPAAPWHKAGAWYLYQQMKATFQ